MPKKQSTYLYSTENPKQKLNQAKTQTISIKTTPEIKAEIERRAKENHQSVSAYMTNQALSTNYGMNLVQFQAEILDNLETIKNNAENSQAVIRLAEKTARIIGGIDNGNY
ncbi:MAG: hypothetical protein NC489_40895 [Ruminococcus flavefaciens]|nr:hypothetical protein [Ruminococcus flavefaciens]